MDLKRLRQRCEDRLHTLELPVPFDVKAFCGAIERQRGRPVILWPIDSGAGPGGAWISTVQADYVFYEQATTSLHQEHIILHELSHLICDHRTASVPESDTWQLVFPDLDANAIEQVLGRSGYAREEELEAELLASLISRRARRSRPSSTGPAAVVGVLDRLGAVLERPERR